MSEERQAGRRCRGTRSAVELLGRGNLATVGVRHQGPETAGKRGDTRTAAATEKVEVGVGRTVNTAVDTNTW